MQLYSLPETVQGLLFDMDLTLYRHHDYYESQIKNQVILVARRLGLPLAEVEARLAAFEHDYAQKHSGKKTSFGNSLLAVFGIPIAESVELRRQAIRPEDYLTEDKQLQETLTALEARFRLILVTNNPADIAGRTLEVLGCSRFFPKIVGLDESGFSKPHPRSFELAVEKIGLEPGVLVSIGDRYAVDLETPLKMGMGGILVESMEEVYALPELLRPYSGLAKS